MYTNYRKDIHALVIDEFVPNLALPKKLVHHENQQFYHPAAVFPVAPAAIGHIGY
jgi:hypothetical protein